MSHSKRLDTASGFFFTVGFIVEKIKFFPVVIVSSLVTLVSLVMYMIAYLLWLIASCLRTDHNTKSDEWYGFAQFKEQYRLASILGLLASVLSITAIFFPVFTIPAVWIFFVSNAVWAVSEYHKLNNPPTNDSDYSSQYQNTYSSYTVTIAAIAFLGAVSTTLIFICPYITVPVIIITSFLGGGLGVLAMHFGFELIFGDKQPGLINVSYDMMSSTLGSTITTHDITASTDDAIHHTNIFTERKPVVTRPIIDTSNLTTDSSNIMGLSHE